MMAFSRVYIAAHYPLDVAAGLLLGAAVTLAGWALVRRLLLRVVEGVRHTGSGHCWSQHLLNPVPS